MTREEFKATDAYIQIGNERKATAEDFYQSLLKEARNSHNNVIKRLESAINN